MIFFDTFFQAVNRPIVRAWCFLAVLLMTLLVVNRDMIGNGFSVLSGDRYDAVISTSLLEHWFNVFSGHTSWSKVLYFYPYDKTIAHTDAYFLIGVAYAPFRLFGLDPFMSAEMAGVVIKSVGFFGMYAFMRGICKTSFVGALLAAVIFTLSNAMTAHSSRLQLATVAFAPMAALFIGGGWDAARRGAYRRMLIHSTLACVLMGAWCMTCFYMAWFFFYLFMVFSICFVAFNWRDSAVVFADLFKRARSYAFVVALVAGVSIAPFAYVFLPKSREVGVRTYNLVFQNTVNPLDMVQLGTCNIFLGPLYCRLLKVVVPGYVPIGEYYNTGVSPVLFVLFVVATFYFWRKKEIQGRLWVKYLAGATLLTWFSVLRFGDYSLWYVVFHLFPGAKALNAIGVYQILLAFPVVVVFFVYWEEVKKGLFLQVAVPALLVVGELNHPYLNLHRVDELNKIKSIETPPRDCTCFYVSGWDWQKTASANDNLYGHNVTAMMVAQQFHLPTLNGFASFNPPDWCFGFPNAEDYDARVLNYARRHGVLEGLYRLDLNTKEWKPVYDSPPQIRIGEKIYPSFDTCFSSGWSYSEKNHRWSDAERSVIRFLFRDINSRPIRLVILGHALGRQRGEIRLNGSLIWAGTVPDAGIPSIIPESHLWQSGLNRLEFIWPDARLPGNGDGRRLAFAFEGLTLDSLIEPHQ